MTPASQHLPPGAVYEDLPDGVCFRRPHVPQSSSSSCDSANSSARNSYSNDSLLSITPFSSANVSCSISMEDIIQNYVSIPPPEQFSCNDSLPPDPSVGKLTVQKSKNSLGFLNKFPFFSLRVKPSLFKFGSTTVQRKGKRKATKKSKLESSLIRDLPPPGSPDIVCKMCLEEQSQASENEFTRRIINESFSQPILEEITNINEVIITPTYSHPFSPEDNETADDEDQEHRYETLGNQSFFTDPPKALCSSPSSVMTMLWYTGSFQVSGEDPEEGSLLIRSRLREMKEGGKSKSILLVISLAGIKVCSPDGKTVFMAHALRRISYATCDPGQKQFSFLAREPKANFSLQYCHAFTTNTADQAEELNSIVGHAFRLAYAAHLQKSSSSVKDVIPSFSSSSSSGHFAYNQSQSQSSPSQTGSAAPSHNSRPQSRLQSHNTSSSLSTPYHSSQHHPSCSGPSTAPHTFTSEPTSPVCCSSTHIHHTLPHTLTHTHTDQRPCSSTCLSRAEFNRENLKAVSSCCSSRPHSRCSSNTATASVSSHCSKSLPFNSSEHSSTMRTPAPGNNISVGGQCGVLKPPSTLPGLHYNDHENNNNNLHSPDSDTSNSPTELNTTRRLGDKPPLIKNVNISLDTNLQLEEELNSVLSCPLNVTTTTQCPTMTATTTQQGNTSVIGYVNEKHGNDFQSNETCSSEDKCLLQEELNLKRMSQISMNSSLTSGNVGVEVSSSSNFSNTPPPLPERSDSLTPPEEPHLKTAAWFQAGIPREIALEVLSREPVGAFMVRESTSKPGCYALSLRVPRDFTVSGIAHYLIVKTTKGYKIKGFTKEFVTLTALITHHSVMPELLPCPLSLSRYNPTFTADDNRNDDDENSDEDPDYNTLSDFRKMMADLNV